MNKRERLLAEKERRKPRKLYDSDYLLGVYDETRMGGIRFKLDKEGEFLSDDQETAAPPWTSLRTLEEASRNFENDESGITEKWLNQLIKPGSSLGGARPKATVVDTQGQLWIAKFPSKNDESDTGAWEKTVHDLARMCGLNVPESKLEKFSKLGSTFLVRRFDRDGKKRIHFASAMTLLGKADGASAADGTSYLDIVAFIKANGANPKADLLELWKRIVFNMLVTNTDDHLRNHAFMLSKNGWVLSPLYDVNPVPYGDELALLVDDEDNSISIDLAISTAYRFGISEEEAKKIAESMCFIVMENWEQLAKKYGLSRGQIEYMRPAFGECQRGSV
jgi:serine/threonine-protein kinase HipA